MKQDNHILAITRLVEDLFEITAVYHRGPRLEFSLVNRYGPNLAGSLLADRLRLAGYDFSMNRQGEQFVLSISPRPRIKVPAINIVLFVLTLFSVYFVPVFYFRLTYVSQLAGAMFGAIPESAFTLALEVKVSAWILMETFNSTLTALAGGAGIEFTLAMISILFVHEMGHYAASRRRNIVTSWPYFIPAPNIIGTFGAIIKSKSPFWNRRDLIEVGSAGPIAGWIVAVAWLVFGLSQSVILPPEAFHPWDLAFSLDGESILMRLAAPALTGTLPEGHFYRLTEAAFAGWVGMLVTAINLLPIGQLDGGHILYGLFRKRQHFLGLVAMGALLVLGIQSPLWWFFAAFGIIFGVKHPPTLNDNKKTGRLAAGMGIVALVILIISFTPVPFRSG